MSEEEEVMSKVDEDLEVESEDSEEEVITIWAAEKNASDDVLTIPIDEWIDDIEFESTEDVPVPERLVDQVIGQVAASSVIRKAAEQRRHMMMIGDPGTGKSMLARSMTELLPKDTLTDVLC